MFDKFKKVDYQSLLIPDELYIEDFENAKADDAIQFADWYFAQIEERIEVLQNYINKSNDIFSLDYTDKSLIKLWTWFEDNLELVKKTDKELEHEKEYTPQVYWKFIQSNRISPLMVKIAIDISYYFADMLLKKHCNLHSDCITKPKWKNNLKKPVISGFFMDMTIYPIELIMECAKRSAEKKNPFRLKMLYDKYSDLACNPFEIKYDSNYPYWTIAPYYRNSELLDFSQATKKTAETFFNNYVNQSSERIDYLFKFVQRNNIPVKKDFTPQSLIPLWELVKKNIIIKPLSANEILEKNLDLAPWFRNKNYTSTTVIDESSSQLLIDLSYYYAEVVIKNYNGAKWSYFTNGRSYIDVNQPLISISNTNYRFRPYLTLFKIAMSSDDKNTLYNEFLKINELMIEYS